MNTGENTQVTDPRLYYRAGLNQMDAKDFEQANESFTIAINNGYHENGRAYWERGVARRNIKDYQGAINDCNHLLNNGLLYNALSKIYLLRAICNDKIEKFQEAIEDYDRLIGLGVYKERAYSERADVKFKLGKFEESIQDYTRAIAIKDDPKYCLNRGINYIRIKNFDFAINDLSLVFNKDPRNYVAQKHLAESYFARATDAILSIKQEPETQNRESRTKTIKRAVSDSSNAIGLQPDDPSYYFLRSIAHELDGSKESYLSDILRTKQIITQKSSKENGLDTINIPSKLHEIIHIKGDSIFTLKELAAISILEKQDNEHFRDRVNKMNSDTLSEVLNTLDEVGIGEEIKRKLQETEAPNTSPSTSVATSGPGIKSGTWRLIKRQRN